MTSFLASMALLTAGIVQAATEAEITAAIEQLGADDFQTREQATRFLWEANAEAAVREASRSRDPEVSMRARQVLVMLERGIRPDTPPKVRELIEEYHRASLSGQQQIILELYGAGAAGRQFLLDLARQEPDVETRAMRFLNLLQDQEPFLGLLTKDTAAETIDRVVTDILFWVEVFPEDITISLHAIRRLDEIEKRDRSDRIFARSYAQQQARCQAHPKNAMWQNNAAWLCAVARRGLENGLKHARQATKLAPQEAAYLDTLAEIRFQQGDQAEAIRLLERCIELDPQLPYFRDQLARIKKGDRASRPPEPE